VRIAGVEASPRLGDLESGAVASLVSGTTRERDGQHLAWCAELPDCGRLFVDRAISGC
jgi:hypothetical protein